MLRSEVGRSPKCVSSARCTGAKFTPYTNSSNPKKRIHQHLKKVRHRRAVWLFCIINCCLSAKTDRKLNTRLPVGCQTGRPSNRLSAALDHAMLLRGRPSQALQSRAFLERNAVQHDSQSPARWRKCFQTKRVVRRFTGTMAAMADGRRCGFGLANDAPFRVHRLRVQMARTGMMRANAPPAEIPGHEKPICVAINTRRRHFNAAAGLSFCRHAHPFHVPGGTSAGGKKQSNQSNCDTSPCCAMSEWQFVNHIIGLHVRFRSRSALAMTTSVAPVSARIASQRLVWPVRASARKIAFTPSAKAMFA